MLFEKAAQIRDTIKMIEKVISQEKISKYYRKNKDYYLIEKRNHNYLVESIEELQKYLGLKSLPLYIEAYDISNIHGQISVGSMITFKEGMPYKKGYRHFKIKDVEGINDFAMLGEVIFRRFRDYRIKNEELPDL